MQGAVTTQGVTKRETGKSALGYSVRSPSIWEREYTLDGKQHGLKIVQVGELDTSTPQSLGMTRAAAVESEPYLARQMRKLPNAPESLGALRLRGPLVLVLLLLPRAWADWVRHCRAEHQQ